MSQQDLIIGTADAKGGDTYFDAFTKVQANITELYGGLNDKVVYIKEEADFPNQDASNIYLDTGFIYTPVESFTTNKETVFQGGRLFGLGTRSGVTMSYGGTGDQFSATDNFLQIEQLVINASNGNHFSFTSSNVHFLTIRGVSSSGCITHGTITGSRGINISSYTQQAATATKGLTFAGTSGVLVVDTVATIAAPSGYISYDFGSATFLGGSIERFFQDTATFGNNAGSIAIAGLASSGNIVSGGVVTVDSCNFAGLTGAATNISPSDIRWEFMNSPPFENSSKEADSYIVATRTVTIAVAGTFVKINGANWASDIAERFTEDNAGTLTFIGERPAKFFASMTSTVEKVGGGADEIEARISLNDVITGTPFEKSGQVTQNSTPTGLTSQRLVTLENGDTISGYVANNTGTANIEVSKANLTIIEVR